MVAGQTALLPSGDRLIVPANTPEPEVPMPDYQLPDPPANAPGLSGFEIQSSGPDDTPVRLILIPAIGVDTHVDFIPFDGETWPLAGLGRQVAWLGDTSWPGLGGNTVLAGHVTISGGILGPFNALNKLKTGDKIFVSTERYVYVYTYMDSSQVDPTDTSVVEMTGSPQLTLITCTDWDSAARSYSKRLVITASLESIQGL